MIYEYECPVHGVFEEMQKISDLPLAECPKCAAEGRQEWECNACDQKVYCPKDVEPSTCCKESCGKEGSCFQNPKPIRPKKLISLGNFHLVGTGWAKDNYK